MDNSTLYERIMRSLPAASDDECWISTYSLSSNGYPQIWGVKDGKGTMQSISRLAYEMHYAEPIPEDMCVCHTCDNPACVNPHHMFLGTHKDNAEDRDRKGRGVKPTGWPRSRRKFKMIYLERRPHHRVKFIVKVPGHPSRNFARLADAVAHRDHLIGSV